MHIYIYIYIVCVRVRVCDRARLECMEVRKACRFLHELSCKVRITERILEEYIFVFRLTFIIIEGKQSRIKKKSTCLALISRICARRGEEGAPRLCHHVCNVYVPGMERKQVESELRVRGRRFVCLISINVTRCPRLV